MALSHEFLLELKYRTDIDALISQYVNLKRSGSSKVGLCPFHNEKTPSFRVYPDKGNFHCFGCGVGGDAITFAMQIENLDYIEAVRMLADKAGLKMPENGVDDKELKLKNDIYEINRQAALFFHQKIKESENRAGLQYMLGRGISERTLVKFGVGFAPNSWNSLINHLKNKGYSEFLIKKADLGIEGKNGKLYDKYRNRVMFPIINLHGKVIGFGGRAMPGEDKSAKYINTSDTPVFKKSHNMFALNIAKNTCSKRVVLAEGYMDVIALHQAGFTSSVAALGTAFTSDQARLLSRYTKEVVVTLDADAAGKKATDRAIDILQSTGVSARVLRLPECKDPDEFIKKNGPARFEALLDGALSDIEYMLYAASDGLDIETDDGRLNYLKRCVDILADSDDGLTRDLYIGRLSSSYGITKTALSSSVDEAIKSRRKKQTRKEIENIVRPRFSKEDVNPEKSKFYKAARAEETVIVLLMNHPDLYQKALKTLPADQMVTEFNRRLYIKVLEILGNGQRFDLIFLGEDFTPKEIGQISMIYAKSTGDNPETELDDAISIILQEKNKSAVKISEDLPDEDWVKYMETIKNKHKGI